MTNDYLYNKLAQPQTITVPAGQRAQITLADGTRVWLNAQSTLTYASNFGRREKTWHWMVKPTLKWQRIKISLSMYTPK